MLFEKSRQVRKIDMTPLIDVVFLLLIFFMLSTSFIRTESMELSIPKGKEVAKLPGNILRVFIYNGERIFLGQEEMAMNELKSQLRLALLKDPERSILLFSGEKVDVQRLVSVMDDIYLMGGKNVSVVEWLPDHGGPVIQEEMVLPEAALLPANPNSQVN